MRRERRPIADGAPDSARGRPPGTLAGMARRLCQFLFTIALLYAAAVGAYALFAYEGTRPDVVTIAGDLHGWVAQKFHTTSAPTPPAGALPPRKDDVAPVPPPPPAVAPAEPPLDARAAAIARVNDEYLPEATAVIEKMSAPGANVESLKVDATVILTRARDLLGPMVDANPSDRELSRTYKRVSDLMIAVHKR